MFNKKNILMTDNIIILCRHGERIDRTGKFNEQRTNEYDSELTRKGNESSK